MMMKFATNACSTALRHGARPLATAFRKSTRPALQETARCFSASKVSSSSSSSSSSYANSVTDLIGSTPMVRLQRLPGEEGVDPSTNILLKLEMQNPGGSVKDRIARSMIEEAEKRGEITPGKTTIVEATSGNTGIGLAMVAAAKGYKCIICMPQVPSMYERYILVRKFGAEVHLTSVMESDFPKTIANLIGYAKELVDTNPGYWAPDQFESDDNPLAHTQHTGPEIWEQCGGQIDAFVAGAGTGGTLNGAGQYFKAKNPKCHVVCVEPTEARVLVGGAPGMHGVVGIGANLKLPLLEKLAPGQEWKEGPRGCIDEFQHASTPECVQWANRLASTEGLLVGPSSGAAVKVAIDLAKREEFKGKNIVVISASSGIRYVSHPMWEKEKLEGKQALPIPPDLENELPIVRWKSEEYVPPESP